MNKQEIENKFNVDENRCKYCNSSYMGCGMMFCSQGYTTDMDCEGKKFILDYNIDEILSTQQLNSGWIPVDRELPSSDGRFEVTIKGTRGKRHVEICNFHKNAKGYPWGSKWDSFHVIAWRKRPEPWKEVSQ